VTHDREQRGVNDLPQLPEELTQQRDVLDEVGTYLVTYTLKSGGNAYKLTTTMHEVAPSQLLATWREARRNDDVITSRGANEHISFVARDVMTVQFQPQRSDQHAAPRVVQA
jgi:hypothetical protein